MIILGIETSCDETAAAVLEKRTDGSIHILSNVIASSAALQAKYGGIIPEQAAREQIKSIIPVIEETLRLASLAQGSSVELDAIAVTYGPGLIGSLLVGVETAKTLAIVWNKPLIPVNHLLGHFWANWISPVILSEAKNLKTNLEIATSLRSVDMNVAPRNDRPGFPCIGLLVSGGHTDLVLFKNEQDYEYLGGTRDDAAGECFDKCARLLGLPYPGGPAIAQCAMKFKVKSKKSKFELPRPMINSKDWEFSFSGLKTNVSNIVYGLSEDKNDIRLTINDKQNLAASIEQAIIDVLVTKTIRAAQKYQVKHIMIAGGVAANINLSKKLKACLPARQVKSKKLGISLCVPPASLCTDNGAMIAARGFFEKPIDPLKLQARPGLGL